MLCGGVQLWCLMYPWRVLGGGGRSGSWRCIFRSLRVGWLDMQARVLEEHMQARYTTPSRWCSIIYSTSRLCSTVDGALRFSTSRWCSTSLPAADELHLLFRWTVQCSRWSDSFALHANGAIHSLYQYKSALHSLH